MITVGPYRYTPTDALRTFANMGAWWTELIRDLPVDDLAPIGIRLAATLERLGPLTETAMAGWPTGRTEAALTSLLEDVAEAAALLRRSGRLATNGHGSVAQLNASGGGVPKTSAPTVEVGFGGINGDIQRTRIHHGRPWQALSLWSAEVIAEFAADGHPITPGGAGENITIHGLPWDLIRPGVRLRIGEVLCEASLYALPCKQTAFNFRDGDFTVMHHERGPVSRMYAIVIEPGRITTGDLIELRA